MDLTYVVFLTLVYWTLAVIMSRDLGYSKYLSFGLWTLMLWIAYPLHAFVSNTWSAADVLILCCVLGSYFALYVLCNRGFPHERSRELFACVGTIGRMILWENLLTLRYWPVSIRREGVVFSPWAITAVLLGLFFVLLRCTKYTYRWMMYRGLEDRGDVLRTVWISQYRSTTVMHLLSYLLLACIWLSLTAATQITPWDGLFYRIKAVGILVVAGISNRVRLYPIACIYVILEYRLFVYGWLPLQYKDGIMLLIILCVLLRRSWQRLHRAL